MDYKKAKTIASAFIKPLPEGEDWYESRVATCKGCEYNIANIPEEDRKFTDKLKINSGVCDDKEHCTACGCCILRKCAVKTEVCGRKDLGLTPLWLPIEVEGDKNLSIEVLDSTGLVSYSSKEYLFDFGQSNEKVLKAHFVLKSGSPIEFKKYSVSCGCTHPQEIIQPDKKSIKLKVDISTINFRVGLTEKLLTVEYKDSRNQIKTAVVRFRVIKL
jgi:hypothetical protein